MSEYFARRKDCKHDKGLMYGHSWPSYHGGPSEFDIVCDWCLKPLYRTGGWLDVEKDPRLKEFTDIPEDERKAHATANLLFKVDQKMKELKKE